MVYPKICVLKKTEKYWTVDESDGIGGCDGSLKVAHPSDAGF